MRKLSRLARLAAATILAAGVFAGAAAPASAAHGTGHTSYHPTDTGWD